MVEGLCKLLTLFSLLIFLVSSILTLIQEINVKATYNLAHHFIKTTGGKGTFINTVTLGAALLAPGGMSAYSSSQLAAVKLGEYLDLGR